MICKSIGDVFSFSCQSCGIVFFRPLRQVFHFGLSKHFENRSRVTCFLTSSSFYSDFFVKDALIGKEKCMCERKIGALFNI
jgi:hypothetical protein